MALKRFGFQFLTSLGKQTAIRSSNGYCVSEFSFQLKKPAHTTGLLPQALNSWQKNLNTKSQLFFDNVIRCHTTGSKAAILPSRAKELGFLAVSKAISQNGMACRHFSSQAIPVFSSKAQALSSVAARVEAHVGSLVAGGVKAQRAVSWWLFGCSGWVFSMVVLGGVTRLTRSGLSMTDWKFTGRLPPITQAEWELEFEKYKASPEYRRVNLGMKMEDFKFIYWMEYAHRMWGRALGIVFLLPFGYFATKGYITRPLGWRLALLGSLGAGQGFVGWWMVQSGLQEPESEHAIPRVSPYRLAAHLASAFVIYSGLVWTALSVALPSIPAETAVQLAAAAKARRFVHPISILIGVTALSGAFVAGNDAGHAYNTFPKMGDEWVPSTILEMKPIIRNFFENTATVQFDHRLLATTTLASVAAACWAASRLPLHPTSAALFNAMLGMTALQVTLGVSTLLTYVPVSLGSAHQAGALTLFTIVVTLLHTLRRPRPIVLMDGLNKLTK